MGTCNMSVWYWAISKLVFREADIALIYTTDVWEKEICAQIDLKSMLLIATLWTPKFCT